MDQTDTQLKLYSELASWWPLLSEPTHYAEEAAFYRRALLNACDREPQTLLELGSGGGNNASHLKAHFRMTLVDRSPGMLAVSAALNPECQHIEGDMRTVRLGHLFDAVFIHDAITYLTTEVDLRAAIETAFVHCKPGGATLFCPDHTRENFHPHTDHGGHDGVDGRSLRYLEWITDPDPSDSTYEAFMVYALRDPNGTVAVEHDRHIEGLFSRDDWLRIIAEVGFGPKAIPFEHSEVEFTMEVFVGTKREGSYRNG